VKHIFISNRIKQHYGQSQGEQIVRKFAYLAIVYILFILF
jgi:hypothetical protein